MKTDVEVDDIYHNRRKFEFNMNGKMSPSNIEGYFYNSQHNVEMDSMFADRGNQSNLVVSQNSINELNIIINDCDCSDTFFEDVCSKLYDGGLRFKTTKNNSDVNHANSVVITLDQQYSSGFDTLIFAPYDNTKIGDSDSLALAMQTSFKQGGLNADKILCGKVGYRVNENGDVSEVIPTETEEAIDLTHNTSFVTISFGTQNLDPEVVSQCIQNGLARYIYYLNNYDSHNDLIYRSTDGESVEMVAGYFNTSPELLIKKNKLENKIALNSQAIINPNSDSIIAFNPDISYKIERKVNKLY